MECPKCLGITRVIDTRIDTKGNTIRIRVCKLCGTHFHTKEVFVKLRDSQQYLAGVRKHTL